ncbi:MAG: DNA-3-methyladenine glycosylase 2 family protein, partial [Saprospiraceae bacterium]|nr:DNA-3-methyladenine glycosylase 2 family protein [Pyrinomonadaceae bacterium]
MIQTLDEDILEEACRELSALDEHLAFVYQTYGAPPLWDRPPGFATLLQIIL